MTEKRNAGQYPIRPTPELRSKLEEAARAGGRSLHAEIIGRLEQSFESSLSQPTAIEALQNLIDQQRIIAAMALLLQDAVELLQDELPPELRADPSFSRFVDQADDMINEYKRRVLSEVGKQ